MVFDVDEATCRRRDRRRDRRVGAAVIRKHRRQLEATLARLDARRYRAVAILDARGAGATRIVRART